eukprot:g1560.t1
MSWQAYVDTQLVATGHTTQAAMIGKEDASVWANTEDFMPRAYQAESSDDAGNPITLDINEAQDFVTMAYYEFEQAPENGLRLNGEKYMWLGTGDEAGTKYVKAAKGTKTMIISGSVSCVIVAVADKAQGQMFGQLIPAVTGLAAYLAESGY